VTFSNNVINNCRKLGCRISKGGALRRNIRYFLSATVCKMSSGDALLRWGIACTLKDAENGWFLPSAAEISALPTPKGHVQSYALSVQYLPWSSGGVNSDSTNRAAVNNTIMRIAPGNESVSIAGY